MQKKTIEKVIKKKIDEWINTISIEDLREKVKANLIVTGGCITSMFQNKEVNDYDVYFKDMDVLVELAEYYSSGKMMVLDGRKQSVYTLEYETRYKATYEEEFGEEDLSKYKIAIDNLYPDQVKLYDYKNSWKKDDYNKSEDKGLYEPVFMSPNAISLSDDIQIVLRFSGSIENIHENFDFIHATNYFIYETGLHVNEEALLSILTGTLKYQGSKYPLTSIIRMKKFIARGWNINAGEIFKILFQVSELKLKNPRVLEEQLIGVDIAYFDKLIQIISGIDEEKITPEYISTIVDRVFNEYENED